MSSPDLDRHDPHPSPVAPRPEPAPDDGSAPRVGVGRTRQAVVASIGGQVRQHDLPALLDQLAALVRSGTLVIDFSAAPDAAEMIGAELGRLEGLRGHHVVLVVHPDLEARRALRRQTGLPVLPSVDVALAGCPPVVALHPAGEHHFTRAHRDRGRS